MIESTYYSQYQSGDKVEIKGKLLSIEEYRGENGSWDNATLLGHFKDNNDNDWITYLNEDEYGIDIRVISKICRCKYNNIGYIRRLF